MLTTFKKLNNIMYVLIIILIVIASVLLTLLVLVQNSKGGGLSAGFSSTNQIMGVRKTTDFLEKATWGLVLTVVVLCVTSVAFQGSNAEKAIKSEIQNPIQQAQKSDQGTAAPDFGATPAAPKAPAAPVKK